MSGIKVVVGLVSVRRVRTVMHNALPHFLSTRVHSAAMGLVVIEVIIWVVTMGLWLWMAVKNRVGRGWARITATVLFGLNTILLLLNFSRPHISFGLLLFLLMWLIGLGAILMLCRKETNTHFPPAPQPQPGA